MVTDYDCWKEEHCTLEAVMAVMKTNNINAQKVLNLVIPKLAKNLFPFKKENTFAVLTKPERMLPEQSHILEVLMR
jgi:5'-methylthioadenosine phosphorylase